MDRVFFPRKTFDAAPNPSTSSIATTSAFNSLRVLGQASEVFVRTRGDIGWQFAVAGRAGGQPVEVPSRDLKVGGERRPVEEVRQAAPQDVSYQKPRRADWCWPNILALLQRLRTAFLEKLSDRIKGRWASCIIHNVAFGHPNHRGVSCSGEQHTISVDLKGDWGFSARFLPARPNEVPGRSTLCGPFDGSGHFPSTARHSRVRALGRQTGSRASPGRRWRERRASAPETSLPTVAAFHGGKFG